MEQALPRISQETAMLPVLLDWLRTSGRVREGSVIAEELPWFGRRVDLAVLTRSGVLLSFELKLQHNRRVIEQAARNALTFDRSYVVTGARPGVELIQLARELGLGIVVMTANGAELLAASVSRPLAFGAVRSRLRSAIRGRGVEIGHV